MDVPAPENFLQQLFDNHRYADLIISATHYLGEHDFFVHKVVVALRCPRFESIHRLQIAEGKVELEEHRGVVEKLVAYIYGRDWRRDLNGMSTDECGEELYRLIRLRTLAQTYELSNLEGDIVSYGREVIDSRTEIADIATILRHLSDEFGITLFVQIMAENLQGLAAMDKRV